MIAHKSAGAKASTKPSTTPSPKRPAVYRRLLRSSGKTIEDVIAALLSAGFATAIDLPAIITGERKPTPGMLRALVSVLGGGEDDEVAAMRAIGWTAKDARAFVRELPKMVMNG